MTFEVFVSGEGLSAVCAENHVEKKGWSVGHSTQVWIIRNWTQRDSGSGRGSVCREQSDDELYRLFSKGSRARNWRRGHEEACKREWRGQKRGGGALWLQVTVSQEGGQGSGQEVQKVAGPCRCYYGARIEWSAEMELRWE